MANISITTVCNRSCSYCFAREARAALSYDQQDLSIERFDQVLNFLESSDLKEARLLGGEPTLHPDFRELVEMALTRDFKILIFSNGLIPERVLSFLESLPADQLTILLNISPPEEHDDPSLQRQVRTMQLLGSKVELGLNIYSRQQKYDFLTDYIKEYSLIPKVRLGLAHPISGSKNSFLQPKFYRQVGQKIFQFMVPAAKKNIRVSFDCGFVPCMFPDRAFDEFEDLLEMTGVRCNPIFDVLSNGNIIHCYPLHNQGRTTLDAGLSIQEHKEKLAEFQSQSSDFGIYPDCTICPYFIEQKCLGGCISQKLRRLSNSEPLTA